MKLQHLKNNTGIFWWSCGLRHHMIDALAWEVGGSNPGQGFLFWTRRLKNEYND